MKDIEEILKNPRLSLQFRDKDGFKATIALPKWIGSVICTNSGGWNHISIAPSNRRIMPSYEDLCLVKDMFWNEEESVIHVFPPKSQYVNNLSNCLHLWECYYTEMVLPPSFMVGLRKGQTMDDAIKEAKEYYKMVGEEY